VSPHTVFDIFIF